MSTYHINIILHELYKKRADSENWIKLTKNQLHASQTLTDDAAVNDILWQLSVLGFNISVKMRYETDKKYGDRNT
jgi:hypothetical protein